MKAIRVMLTAVLVALLLGCDHSGDFFPVHANERQFEPDYNAASAVVLNVPFYSQQTEVWCWAAAIEMISAYYNKRVAQCQTLAYWHGVDCCAFSTSSCVTAGSEYQIDASFNTLSIYSDYHPYALSWQGVKESVDQGSPLILYYNGSFSGHVVVVFGYNDVKQTLFIHDPFHGTFEVPYGDSFSYSGQLYWSQTRSNFVSL